MPPSAVCAQLCALAGGPDAVAERAAAHAAAGEPGEALHLAEIALAADPRHRAALEAQLTALEELIDRTGGETFDELSYLESEAERVPLPALGSWSRAGAIRTRQKGPRPGSDP